MNLQQLPVAQRIASLDLIRGIAVLGILLMNIASFSMIGTAYINPSIMGGMEGLNGLVHDFNFLFANQKFMSLFSILFGAGIVLFSERMISKSLSSRKYFLKRQFYLFLFGMFHAYLIWMGDILVAYSICGILAFFFRNKSKRTLLILFSIIFFVPVILNTMWYVSTPASIINDNLFWWHVSEVELSEELITMRGSFLDVQTLRSAGALELQTIYFALHTFWRALSLMILGMYLYKSNIIQGLRSKDFYLKLLLVGLVLGLGLSYHGLSIAYANDWDAAHGFVYADIFNYMGALFTALGYLALFCLWSKSNWFLVLQHSMKKVGRMAFTNYIMTSVISTLFFYGYGMGYFGHFDRVQQLIFVVIVWIILICFSNFYLAKYKQGPLEALWRKLIYL